MRILAFSFLLGLPCVLGCTAVGEDYEAPTLPAGETDSWNGRLDGVITAEDLDPEVLARWWTLLEDPILTSLIERAATSNLDLRRALAQVRQARAERQISQAQGGPTLGIGGSAARAGTSENSGPGGQSELYSASLDASWEIDVFGGIAREQEAAEADLQATEEARRDVLVTTLAEVALNYVDLRTLQRRRGLAQENLTAQQETLRIVRLQEDAGAASQLEVDQALADVASTSSRLPAFDQQIQQTMNRLAVLLGQAPGTNVEELQQALPLPVPPARVAVGVPAQVLRRRPDVRQAERRLAGQTARVGVAIAELYPKLQLRGSIGLESLSLSSLFEVASKVWNFGPRAQWTLYDGGRTRKLIEVQDALQEQALVDYEQSILIALEEVENAIVGFTQEQLRLNSLQSAAQASTRAMEAARARYDAGDTDFLAVLDAQRARANLDDELAQSRGLIVGNLVRLYKALGGGWNAESQPDSGSRR